ncbi:MAG: PA0069 family radical SAM protein [Acidobacteriota bacterium]
MSRVQPGQRPSASLQRSAPKGRGADSNPASRFERLEVELETPGPDRLPTVLLKDASRSVISRNQSPDIPFEISLNPYRGCEHGCAYCYARPSHEFLGLSPGLDFETRIVVKETAAELLARELAKPSWEPKVLAFSGVTDPYQPVEKRLRITRGCLEVLAEHRHPTGLITKNALVTRDLDLLRNLADHGAVSVTLSITTLDGELARNLEPRASHPRRRLQAIRQLADAGIPVGVMTAPVIPGLTDHELPALLAAAAEAGASYAGFTVLRLPGAVAGLFEDWLQRCYPDGKDKVLRRVRALHGGRAVDPRFGHRMRGAGVLAGQIADLFAHARRRAGLSRRRPVLSADAFRRPGAQLSLF